MVRRVFKYEFELVNEKFGDVHSNFDKTEDEFFKDNVPRVIEHDELHSRVAVLYRDDKEPLFKRFQREDQANVEMDRVLFLEASFADKIQTLIEEITVLLLERKVLPELKSMYKDEKRTYPGSNKERRREELREISAHFVTNLCGGGHHWLRRFALDHYEMISDIDMFDLDKIDKLAVEITGVKTLTQENVNSWMSFGREAKDSSNKGFMVGRRPRRGYWGGQDNEVLEDYSKKIEEKLEKYSVKDKFDIQESQQYKTSPKQVRTILDQYLKFMGDYKSYTYQETGQTWDYQEKYIMNLNTKNGRGITLDILSGKFHLFYVNLTKEGKELMLDVAKFHLDYDGKFINSKYVKIFDFSDSKKLTFL